MGTPRLFIVTIAFIALASPTEAAEVQTGFRSDYAAARAEAAATGRPLLIHFYADYCPPCRRMEAETFPDPELNRRMLSLVVAVKVNTGTASGREIAKKYQVDLIPHDRILTPDGKELRRAGGFIDKMTYLTMLQDAAKRWESLKPKPAVPGVIPKVVAENPVRTPKAKTQQKVIEDAILGLDGYCPVALGLHRRWTKGTESFSVEYKGIGYKISSKENLERFRSKPEMYAPQVLGCDPVVLSKSQRAIPGKTSYGAFFDDKLFLFESQSSRTTFKANPLKYVRIQHALDASKIERTVVR